MYRIATYINESAKSTKPLRVFFNSSFKKLAGKSVIITIAEKKKKRSIEHNAYLWAHIYKVISDHTGYPVNDLHRTYKEMYLGYEQEKVIDFKTGERVVVHVLGSTTKLTVSEFSGYVELVRSHGIEFHGCSFDDMGSWAASNPDLVEKYGYAK